MTRMDRKGMFAVGALVFLVCASVALAQSPSPTGPPGPRDEARREYVVSPRTECGVEVGGTLDLGASTIGASTLTSRNAGNQPIVAFRMGLDYRTASGADISNPGDMFFVSVKSPGEAWFMPGDSNPLFLFGVNVAHPNDRILGATPRVHAVVYADGSTCGADGERMLRQYQSRVTNTRNTLAAALDASKKLDAEGFRRFVQNEDIASLPQGRVVALYLKKGMLDSAGNLRPDAIARIQAWIDNLDRPFQTGAGG